MRPSATVELALSLMFFLSGPKPSLCYPAHKLGKELFSEIVLIILSIPFILTQNRKTRRGTALVFGVRKKNFKSKNSIIK